MKYVLTLVAILLFVTSARSGDSLIINSDFDSLGLWGWYAGINDSISIRQPGRSGPNGMKVWRGRVQTDGYNTPQRPIPHQSGILECRFGLWYFKNYDLTAPIRFILNYSARNGTWREHDFTVTIRDTFTPYRWCFWDTLLRDTIPDTLLYAEVDYLEIPADGGAEAYDDVQAVFRWLPFNGVEEQSVEKKLTKPTREVSTYDVLGRRVSNMRYGMYFVVKSDGSIKKVLRLR
jgi:hypothetical protein